MRYENGISTREESYWFGFLIGDGNLTRGRNRITIVLQKSDTDHLDACRDFFGNGRVKDVTRTYKEEVRIYSEFRIENKLQTSYLTALGFRPAKSHNVGWSDVPFTYRMDFIRGLFDADGTIHIKYPTCVLRWVGTESIVSAIRETLAVYGDFKKLPKVVLDRGMASFGVNGRWKAEKLGDILWYGSTVHLERKYNKYMELKEHNRTHPRLRSKFSDEQVKRIRALRNSGVKLKIIGDMYDISESMVSRIARGHRYQAVSFE